MKIWQKIKEILTLLDELILQQHLKATASEEGRGNEVPSAAVWHRPQAHPAADAARPASSKRPPPPEQTERGGDYCKKAKRVGKGIPMDALCRFYEEHDPEFASKLRHATMTKVDGGRPPVYV